MFDFSPGIWMVIVFFVLMAIRVPIAFSIGLSSFLALYLSGFGFGMVADLLFANVAKFSLLAIPFFILAGVIMGELGLATRIIYFVQVLVGNFKGGLAVVTTVVALFWGAVSGSGPASVAAIGPFLIKGMDDEKYDKGFATALTCTAAALAIVIPPSISLVVYGVLAETSIAELFLAAVIPGMVVGFSIAAYAWYRSYREGWGGSAAYNRADLWKAFKDAFWALLTPVIILGGIYGGVFTPTEAAIVATVYALFVGGVVYRNLTWKKLYTMLVNATVSSSVVMVVVAFAGVFGWVMAVEGLVESFSRALLSLSTNPYVIILVINIILLMAGMLMDAITITYIALPVLLPVIRYFGWDPVWFGVLMSVNLAIGLVTPPVGINLYVGANTARISFERVASSVIPFVLAAIVGMLIVAYVPALSQWLPNLLMR